MIGAEPDQISGLELITQAPVTKLSIDKGIKHMFLAQNNAPKTPRKQRSMVFDSAVKKPNMRANSAVK
jgi:hypothetical protein